MWTLISTNLIGTKWISYYEADGLPSILYFFNGLQKYTLNPVSLAFENAILTDGWAAATVTAMEHGVVFLFDTYEETNVPAPAALDGKA